MLGNQKYLIPNTWNQFFPQTVDYIRNCRSPIFRRSKCRVQCYMPIETTIVQNILWEQENILEPPQMGRKSSKLSKNAITSCHLIFQRGSINSSILPSNLILLKIDVYQCEFYRNLAFTLHLYMLPVSFLRKNTIYQPCILSDMMIKFHQKAFQMAR